MTDKIAEDAKRLLAEFPDYDCATIDGQFKILFLRDLIERREGGKHD